MSISKESDQHTEVLKPLLTYEVRKRCESPCVYTHDSAHILAPQNVKNEGSRREKSEMDGKAIDDKNFIGAQMLNPLSRGCDSSYPEHSLTAMHTSQCDYNESLNAYSFVSVMYFKEHCIYLNIKRGSK